MTTSSITNPGIESLFPAQEPSSTVAGNQEQGRDVSQQSTDRSRADKLFSMDRVRSLFSTRENQATTFERFALGAGVSHAVAGGISSVAITLFYIYVLNNIGAWIFTGPPASVAIFQFAIVATWLVLFLTSSLAIAGGVISRVLKGSFSLSAVSATVLNTTTLLLSIFYVVVFLYMSA